MSDIVPNCLKVTAVRITGCTAVLWGSPKKTAMVLLTSVLNLPGLLRPSDLLARILSFPFCLNIIFQALASFAVWSIKCLLGCSCLCFQSCSGNKSLTFFFSLKKNEVTIGHFLLWSYKPCRLLEVGRLSPNSFPDGDPRQVQEVFSSSCGRLEWASLCPASLPNTAKTKFGQNKTLPTFYSM